MSSTMFEKKDSTLNVWPDGRLDTAISPVLEKRCVSSWRAFSIST